MKAAVFHGAGKPLTIEILPDPEPAPDEIVIKVHRCGICGTDLHLTSGDAWDFPAGMVLGHEYSGVVESVGSAVTDYKVGDFATALPSKGCGKCVACLRGNPPLCAQGPQALFGGFGEYLSVPTSAATKLPATLSLTDGALIEPLAVGLHGALTADIQPGERVLVLGAGAVGLCAIYWARRMGAGKIVAASRSDRRAPMALEMGADAFVAYGENEVGEVIEALGGSPNVVFEGVGVPGFVAKSLMHVATYGRVVSMGFCTHPDPILPALGSIKSATVTFPVGYSPGGFQHVADVMDAGHVDPKVLVSSTVALVDMPATFESLRGPNNETKVHVISAGG